jgi:peroxiredoxin
MQKNLGKQDARVRLAAMMALGAGLILIGGALAAQVIATQAAARPAGPGGDDSAIPVEVNFPAPTLQLQNTFGESESLEDYRGRVVLVNNWATWCPPCRAEMTTLQSYYERHEADGLTVIGIEAGEPAPEVLAFAASFGLTFPVWVDTETAALEAFHNSSLPNSYVIDRTGTVRLAWIGEISMPVLELHVTPLLAEDF